MELTDHVQLAFEENQRATLAAGERLQHPIALASQAMTGCLLEGGKVIVCGNAAAGLCAQYFTLLMQTHLQLPRPALPAICLSGNAAVLEAIAQDTGQHQVFANQLATLGQANDLLFTVCSESNDACLVEAVRVALDRDLRIVSLSGESSDELSALLGPEDIEINIAADNRQRTHEIQMLTIHSICDLIDKQLMGQ